VTKLASRIAGGRLLAILAVLLLPLLILGYLTVQRLLQDMAFTERQIEGLSIIEKAMPLLAQSATRKIDNKAAETAFGSVLGAAEHIGVTAELEGFKKNIMSEWPPRNETFLKAAQFFEIVGTKSGLLLDAGPESHALALAVARELPVYVVELQGVSSGLLSATAAFDAVEEQVRKLVWSLGRLQGAVDRSSSAILSAQEASTNGADYAIALIQMDEVSSSVGELSSNLVANSDKETVLASMTRSRPQLGRQFASATELHSDVGKTLLQQLNLRLKEQSTSFMLLLSTVIACTVLAIGGSIALFMRTLKRLDQVEIERLRAEAMGEKVNAINSDLANVNRELADKMTSLKQAQDELINKRRMEQLGQLTATIAHEIRNPLGSVRTSAFLLQKKIGNKGLGVEQQIDRINKGVVRCDNIITQLLDYSRTKSVQSQHVKLDDWLATLIGDEAQRLPSQVELECELGLGDLEVPIDSSRLQRAVINLLNNASEAMLTESRAPNLTKPFAIRISTALSDGMVVLSVRDTGPGISPENMAKVREPLFTTKSFGTGLGIPAIEQIAQQHGGRLDIESELGQGATFTLYLPLKPVETEETLQAA
jgi:signal transduction histidine kinase